MLAQIKANTTDKYLRPIRNQIIELIDQGSDVIEFGCGTGDLLFQLASKINNGIGIDNNEALIAFANKNAKLYNVGHVTFHKADALDYQTPKVDYAVASLLFHVLPWQASVSLLQRMLDSSETTIVCAFVTPETTMQRLMLYADQRFTKHYQHFKTYIQQGGMNGLLKAIGVNEFELISTFDPVIKLYNVSQTTH